MRVNFHYSWDSDQCDFLIHAVLFMADHAWRFLPQYLFYADTGEWIHVREKKFPQRRWLGGVQYSNAQMKFSSSHSTLYPLRRMNQPTSTDSPSPSQLRRACWSQYLAACHELSARSLADAPAVSEQTSMFAASSSVSRLKWYLLPSEALKQLKGEPVDVKPSPFTPKQYATLVLDTSLDARPEASAAFLSSAPQSPPATSMPGGPGGASACIPHSAPDTLLELDASALGQARVKRAPSTLPEIPKKEILNPVRRAMIEFNMVRQGDRVLLGLSGGKVRLPQASRA